MVSSGFTSVKKVMRLVVGDFGDLMEKFVGVPFAEVIIQYGQINLLLFCKVKLYYALKAIEHPP